MSHRSGMPVVWSLCRWVRKSLSISDAFGSIWYILCMVPLPQSMSILCSPASMSVLGPNRS